jgi:hypothetical protein
MPRKPAVNISSLVSALRPQGSRSGIRASAGSEPSHDANSRPTTETTSSATTRAHFAAEIPGCGLGLPSCEVMLGEASIPSYMGNDVFLPAYTSRIECPGRLLALLSFITWERVSRNEYVGDASLLVPNARTRGPGSKKANGRWRETS